MRILDDDGSGDQEIDALMTVLSNRARLIETWAGELDSLVKATGLKKSVLFGNSRDNVLLAFQNSLTALEAALGCLLETDKALEDMLIPRKKPSQKENELKGSGFSSGKVQIDGDTGDLANKLDGC